MEVDYVRRHIIKAEKLQDGLILPNDARITPVPIGEDISSLSAILLNDEYYGFLRDGVRKIDGLPVLDEMFLIPFKAKAWLDLTERRTAGGRVDSTDIRKHKRDIYRLSDFVRDGFQFALPPDVEADMGEFVRQTQETLANTPKKEQPRERERIEKLVRLFGLQPNILQWKLSMPTFSIMSECVTRVSSGNITYGYIIYIDSPLLEMSKSKKHIQNA
ncbi:MAG: hypothetical protein LBS84_04130 [Clostridiales bacterium]|nr:hypothetical protein [Clostridiales bacterium]